MLMRRKESMRMSRTCDRVYGVGARLGSVSAGARTFLSTRLGPSDLNVSGHRTSTASTGSTPLGPPRVRLPYRG